MAIEVGLISLILSLAMAIAAIIFAWLRISNLGLLLGQQRKDLERAEARGTDRVEYNNRVVSEKIDLVVELKAARDNLNLAQQKLSTATLMANNLQSQFSAVAEILLLPAVPAPTFSSPPTPEDLAVAFAKTYTEDEYISGSQEHGGK